MVPNIQTNILLHYRAIHVKPLGQALERSTKRFYFQNNLKLCFYRIIFL